MSDSRLLFREFLRAPSRVATVTASSDALVAEMIRPFPTRPDPVIVELGAGSGRVTDAVQERLRGRGRHLAVEINPRLAARLAARHPRVTVVCADAGTLPRVLSDHEIERVDLLASLLPWGAYASAPIPAIAAALLAPGGTSTQATLSMTQWLPPARRQARDTDAAFATVHRSGLIWRNLPPARVRIARIAPAR